MKLLQHNFSQKQGTLLMSAAVRELRHSLSGTAAFSPSLSPLSPPAYLSTHKLCPHLSSPRWGFMYTPVCLYGFLLPQLLTAESLPDLLCLDFATKKKKKKIIQSKKTLVSLRKAFRSLIPLQASFYPTAFRFLGTLNEKNKLM